MVWSDPSRTHLLGLRIYLRILYVANCYTVVLASFDENDLAFA
jgi:hypothetical protein